MADITDDQMAGKSTKSLDFLIWTGLNKMFKFEPCLFQNTKMLSVYLTKEVIAVLIQFSLVMYCELWDRIQLR